MVSPPLSAAASTYDELLSRTDAPAGSTWGLFDRDRERGMADLAGPEQVRRAVASVLDGHTFSLDHPLEAFDPPLAPGRAPLRHSITARHEHARDDKVDDFLLQASSQLDGLRHRRDTDHGFYDGHPDDTIVSGSPTLGVQRWAEHPIVGRGVLLDVEELRRSQDQPLDHGTAPVLEVADLVGAVDRQGLTLETGDIILVHTGWSSWYLGSDPASRAAVRAPLTTTGFAQRRELARWIWDHRVATFATDTFAVERVPPIPDSEFLPEAVHDKGLAHQELIARLGLPLGELWRLDDLTQACRSDGRWTSLVVSKPLHLSGGVGSPANATAMR